MVTYLWQPKINIPSLAVIDTFYCTYMNYSHRLYFKKIVHEKEAVSPEHPAALYWQCKGK
jgi:hypothetical protein